MSLYSGVGDVQRGRRCGGSKRQGGRGGGNRPGPWASALLAASPDVRQALADLRRAWEHFDEVSGVLPDDPRGKLQVVRRLDVATADLTSAERRVVFLLQDPDALALDAQAPDASHVGEGAGGERAADDGPAQAPTAGGAGAAAGPRERAGRARARQAVVWFPPLARRRASHGAGGDSQSA